MGRRGRARGQNALQSLTVICVPTSVACWLPSPDYLLSGHSHIASDHRDGSLPAASIQAHFIELRNILWHCSILRPIWLPFIQFLVDLKVAALAALRLGRPFKAGQCDRQIDGCVALATIEFSHDDRASILASEKRFMCCPGSRP